ncbi:MAG: sensor histidine kinase, partial [Bacteroidota bacterium]
AELAQQEAELAATQARQRFWTVLALSLAGLALGIWLLARYRASLRRIQSEQRELRQAQELERMQREATEGNLRSLIEGQELERQRIAKELHDGLGGLLATVSRGVGEMAAQLNSPAQGKGPNHSTGAETRVAEPPPDRPAEVQNRETALWENHPTQTLIDRACADLRQIAHDLAPQALTVSGLTGALEDIADQLRLKGMVCDLEVYPELDQAMDVKQQVMILRLVQELTHNVVKHADAESVFVQLVPTDGRLLLTVEDDGRGFDLQRAEQNRGGLGLNSVRQRVAFLQGDLEIDTAPGRGTTVVISIPIANPQ